MQEIFITVPRSISSESFFYYRSKEKGSILTLDLKNYSQELGIPLSHLYNRDSENKDIIRAITYIDKQPLNLLLNNAPDYSNHSHCIESAIDLRSSFTYDIKYLEDLNGVRPNYIIVGTKVLSLLTYDNKQSVLLLDSRLNSPMSNFHLLKESSYHVGSFQGIDVYSTVFIDESSYIIGTNKPSDYLSAGVYAPYMLFFEGMSAEENHSEKNSLSRVTNYNSIVSEEAFSLLYENINLSCKGYIG